MLKLCNLCNIEKNLADFRKDSSKPDGYRYECKVCSRARQRSQYVEKYGEASKQRNRDRHAAVKQLILDHKLANPCRCCGEAELVVLEFHHTDPEQKDFTISGNYNRSAQLILEEIQKCVVVCSNCHKKIHAGLIAL